MKPIRLGLLDAGERTVRLNSLEIVSDLMEYARVADDLGYSRLWLTEHHFTYPKIPWNSPQMLLPLLAGTTDRIRVGVAGVLMTLHQPYHVASNFKLLSNLFPDRIDLGLANGRPGADIVERAIGPTTEPMGHRFDRHVDALMALWNDEEKLWAGGNGILIPPYRGRLPDVWMLGSSYDSLQRALQHGTHFARSLFHEKARTDPQHDRLAEFQAAFAARHGREPEIVLAVSGFCHTNPGKIRKASDQFREGFEMSLIGSPNLLFDKVSQYCETYRVDEVIFMNLAIEPADRLLAIERISDAFDLAA